MSNEFMSTITRNLHKIGFELKKHGPEILVVAGVVGTVTSAVMACKASTKVTDILNEAQAKLGAIKEIAETDAQREESNFTKEDVVKAQAIIYMKTGVELLKLYGPSLALGVASITSILAGHDILRKRNVAIAAAYATLDKGFKSYRNRVVERFGEELDKELRYNIKAVEVKETVVDEDGKKKTVKKTIKVSDPVDQFSDYARCFSPGNIGWDDDPEFSLMFLKRQQEAANKILKSKGYLLLNDVYDMLGFHKTVAGQTVGWLYRPNDDNHRGDNYVDFGIYRIDIPENIKFVNGDEKCIWLDFNVDGPIVGQVYQAI